ncbi:hypothetical protein QJQ45_020399 [Haematococcus lacustris]|nr:hypothetical protein QJQ45_020399 [Haematococcus lacustris]
MQAWLSSLRNNVRNNTVFRLHATSSLAHHSVVSYCRPKTMSGRPDPYTSAFGKFANQVSDAGMQGAKSTRILGSQQLPSIGDGAPILDGPPLGPMEAHKPPGQLSAAAYSSGKLNTFAAIGVMPVATPPAVTHSGLLQSITSCSQANPELCQFISTPQKRRLSIGSTFSARASMAVTDSTLLGPKRPRPHKIWKKKYIKAGPLPAPGVTLQVMVVGDSGLGKTTLIRSLMSTPGERLQFHDGSFTPTSQFLKDPDSLCSTISWRDDDDRVIWVYKIQDTPGYGDDLNVDRSISQLTAYIEEQNIKWLGLEQSRDRKDDLTEVEDPRVDICLFAIPPHRMRALDLKVMYELGRHVPLVPVVTKADTMSVREASTYRNDVATKLSNPMLPGIRDKINVFKFERDTLERAGITDHATPTPPFLVVASNDINEDLNAGDPPVYWPERRYPWGIAEAFNRDHSDLLGLRALLLKEALEEINKTKRQRYEEWRRRALGGVKAGRRLRSILMWTIIPVLVALQIGRHNIDMEQVQRKVKSTVHSMRQRIAGLPTTAPAPQALPTQTTVVVEQKKGIPVACCCPLKSSPAVLCCTVLRCASYTIRMQHSDCRVSVAMADAHTAGAPETARKRKRRSDAHGQPEITRGQQPSTSAMQVHVSVAPAGTQACSCYFPAGQPPTAAQFSLYALEQSNAKRGKLYTMVGQQDRMQWVGRSQGEDYAPGAQPVNQVLGVLDKQTGQLSLLPLCGGRVMRMEPRLPGLNYSMDASQAAGAEEEEGPETREQRLAANKKLVDSFGSTRRRRQLTAREEGVVRVEKLGDAAGTLSDLLTQVASDAAAQGLTKQQVAAAATDVRLLPPYVLDASSPEEAYPLSTLIPPDVGAALRIGKLLGAAESAESLQTLREKKWVHEAVLDRIVLLKDPDAAQVKRRARLLMFLSALLQLKAARPNLAVDLADGGLERLARSLHLNNDLLEPLLTLFYHTSMEGNRTRYTLSKEGEVRMVAFICVTSLLVEHNATLAPAQFSTLAGALRMPTDKLVARFREVGATCTPARAVKDVEADTAAPLVAPGRAYTCVLLPDRSKTLADVLPGIKLIKRK